MHYVLYDTISAMLNVHKFVLDEIKVQRIILWILWNAHAGSKDRDA